MDYLWNHTRRFNAYSNYFKKEFGTRVQKLSIDAGFTCPNRDGKVGRGGCSFCNNEAFNPSYCQTHQSITWQIEEGKRFHAWRYKRAVSYLAYFQAYSNTYAPLAELKKKYEEALACEDVIGLVIGSRPDCVEEEVLAYLADLSQKYYIHLELGVESCYDKTLLRVNRGHDFASTQSAFALAKRYGVQTGAHLILGLPGETKEEMLLQAPILSSLGIKTLKFHQLQILKGSMMEQEYLASPEKFSFFELDEYIDFIIDFLEILDPSIIIERFAGEVPPRFQIGPCFAHIRNEQILL
ncbi:MAG: TIGR01212 family radical SAM protein, partial [Bacteroidales bacterium]